MAEMKDFTCRTCGAQFDGRAKLDKHNRREHGAHIQQSSADSGPQRGGQTGSQRLQQHPRSGEGESQGGDDDTNRATESSGWEEKEVEEERGLS
jgi:hypothetical protein